MLISGTAIALCLGYLMGSIPFGLLLTRMAGLGDIRAIGSGNIGATNVLRTGNKKLAAATLLLDALKGTAAVLIVRAIAPDLALAAGLAAFLGHLFPIWLKFKGGKGVATYIGVLFAIAWQAGLFFCAVWLLVAVTLRLSSLAALVAAVLTPILLFFLGLKAEAALFSLMSVLLFAKHHENISRLLKGEEPKIGASKPAAET